MVEKSSLYKQIFKVTEIFFTLAWPHGRRVSVFVYFRSPSRANCQQ